jgi:hypothetical protein
MEWCMHVLVYACTGWTWPAYVVLVLYIGLVSYIHVGLIIVFMVLLIVEQAWEMHAVTQVEVKSNRKSTELVMPV